MTTVEGFRSLAVDKDGDFTKVYEEHLPLLIGVAVERFQIGRTDAETLAHEVFVSYFLKAGHIRDPRTWLLGAIFNASKHYVRERSRLVALPPETVDIPDPNLMRVSDSLPNQICGRQLFSCLTPRCQLALRLRYLEGHTVPEIAAQLRTTAKYAQNLVCRCLRAARESYLRKGDS